MGMAGTYTYTYTGDCLASSTLASLGLNNNYYQYYSAALTAGTWAYASAAQTITYTAATPAPVTAITSTASTSTLAFTGCYHSHIYNWIAMPSMSASGAVTSSVNGFGSAVCAYGYSMVGTATTDFTVTETAGASTTIVPVWGQHGPGYFTTVVGTAITNSGTQAGLAIIA